MSLAKLPAIAAFVYANYVTWTPTNTSPKNEHVGSKTFGEKWIEVEIRLLGLIRTSFLAQGIVEATAILLTRFPPLAHLSSHLALNGNANHLQLDTLSAWGVTIVSLGTFLRYVCYKTMGRNYTFELAIRKGHQLVKTGPYGYVRHPAYTGIAIIYVGYLLWYLSPGSWVRESGILTTVPGFLILTPWIIFMIGNCFALCFGRAPREDEELKKAFGKEWEQYAKQVPYRVFPGLY